MTKHIFRSLLAAAVLTALIFAPAKSETQQQELGEIIC
jgi:hypothetical protein